MKPLIPYENISVPCNKLSDNNKIPRQIHTDMIISLPKFVRKQVGDKMFIPNLGCVGTIISWYQSSAHKITYLVKPDFSQCGYGITVNLRGRT